MSVKTWYKTLFASGYFWILLSFQWTFPQKKKKPNSRWLHISCISWYSGEMIARWALGKTSHEEQLISGLICLWNDILGKRGHYPLPSGVAPLLYVCSFVSECTLPYKEEKTALAILQRVEPVLCLFRRMERIILHILEAHLLFINSDWHIIKVHFLCRCPLFW